jgi:hypothetical protein
MSNKKVKTNFDSVTDSINSVASFSSLVAGSKRAANNQRNSSASSSSFSSSFKKDESSMSLEQKKDSLLHLTTSALVKFDLKRLFQPAIFETLPRESQLKLIKLMPECDRQLDCYGSFKLSMGALNNEFIKKCYNEWQKKLENGEFVASSSQKSNNILMNNTSKTRATAKLKQKILEEEKK